MYQSWDKILVDMEVRGAATRASTTRRSDGPHHGRRRHRQGRAPATSDEKWVDVSKAQYQAMEKNLGMAIEHKPAGKYETESERVAQPAGFAYMAPPGQSNQYGHWEHSDGTRASGSSTASTR